MVFALYYRQADEKIRSETAERFFFDRYKKRMTRHIFRVMRFIFTDSAVV